jgi:hypothetical protein
MNTSDYAQRLKETGRNDLCPCGSGKKYKACHLPEDEAARSAELAKAAEARAAALAEAKAEDDTDAAKDKLDRNGKPRRDEHQRGGKASSGKSRPTNIPRRGAV